MGTIVMVMHQGRRLLFDRRDVALTVVVTALSFITGIDRLGTWLGWTTPQRPSDALAVLLVLGQALPLLLLTRAPAASVLAISAAFGVHQALGYSPTFATISLYIALFNAGSRQRTHRKALMVTEAAAYVGLALVLSLLGSANSLTDYALFFPLPAGCWVLGAWTRRLLLDQARAKDDALRATMQDERERIARELHDVVTHHVTAMVMQSQAARYQHPGIHPELTRLFLGECAGTVPTAKRGPGGGGIRPSQMVALATASIVKDRRAAVRVADSAQSTSDLGNGGVPGDLLECAVATPAQRRRETPGAAVLIMIQAQRLVTGVPARARVLMVTADPIETSSVGADLDLHPAIALTQNAGAGPLRRDPRWLLVRCHPRPFVRPLRRPRSYAEYASHSTLSFTVRSLPLDARPYRKPTDGQ